MRILRSTEVVGRSPATLNPSRSRRFSAPSMPVPASLRMKHTSGWPIPPSQTNSERSTRSPESCNSCWVRGGPKNATVSPSGLAASPMKFVAAMPPAPGMFFTTMSGLPGMCLPRCRATIRPSMSVGPPAV